jgi:hypothetical protein
VSRLDKEKNHSHALGHSKGPNEGKEAETAIRRSLEPISDDMLPLIREIATADEAVHARELAHYGRYRDLLKREAEIAGEYLRDNGNDLLPNAYHLIKEPLNQAKATDSGDDVARLAAQKMSGDAVPILLAATAEALRNPAVIDHLAQLRAAERLLQVLDRLSGSSDEHRVDDLGRA